jgi:site-specific recombinase XerC
LDDAAGKRLSRAEFQGLGEMPPELEWFANLDNPRTRRAYRNDVKEFTAFAGVTRPEEMRQVTRAHLIAWRKDLERRGLAPSSIRRKLAAVASLFDHPCEVNAVSHNPVRGVKRPKAEGNEGKTPARGDGQARALLEAPPADTLKGKRDRAILATFLHHGLRCEELCGLRVRDLQSRQGVPHLRVLGKGSKVRYVLAHPLTLERIHDYLQAAGHGEDADGPLFEAAQEPGGAGGHRASAYPRGHLPPNLAKTRPDCRAGFRLLRAARPAGHGGHQRPGPRRRPGQSAGMAGPRERVHHPALRPAPLPARRQPHLPRGVLMGLSQSTSNGV